MLDRWLGLLLGCSFFLGASSLLAQDSKAEIAGSWDSDRGFVFLKTEPIAGKNHLAVTGTYHPGPDQKGVVTSGTYDPATGVLEFSFEESWRKPAKGSARLTIAPNGKHFKG